MSKHLGALDRVVLGAGLIFAVLSGWAALGPGSMALPVAVQVVNVLAMITFLLGHMLKHLGVKLMIAFFLTAAVIEWAFEQSNISFGGFIWGELQYGNLGVFSVHVGDVPLAVPILMAAILWPTYAAVNLALDGRVVTDPKSMAWWQNIWRCLLYGMVHSWLMLMINGVCEKYGIYTWVGRTAALRQANPADVFLGDPTAPRGWAIYVFVTMLVFTFVMVPLLGRTALEPAERGLNWADGVPVLFFLVMGIQMYASPANLTEGNIALWTFGFFGAFVGYRFVALMRAQAQPPAVGGRTSPESDAVTH